MLSHLQIGRAAALLEDWPAARKSYQAFFSAWKDADPGIPVMAQARGEFDRLK